VCELWETLKREAIKIRGSDRQRVLKPLMVGIDGVLANLFKSTVSKPFQCQRGRSYPSRLMRSGTSDGWRQETSYLGLGTVVGRAAEDRLDLAELRSAEMEGVWEAVSCPTSSLGRTVDANEAVTL